MRIRKYKSTDIEAVSRLAGQLGYPVEASTAGGLIDAIQEDPDHLLLVADDEHDGCIGWVHVYITQRIFTPPFADVGGLVVEDSHRGSGVGAELMRGAEDWAKRKGCALMIVRSNVIRERAHQFYLRLGYQSRKQQQVFRKLL